MSNDIYPTGRTANHRCIGTGIVFLSHREEDVSCAQKRDEFLEMGNPTLDGRHVVRGDPISIPCVHGRAERPNDWNRIIARDTWKDLCMGGKGI